MSNKKAAVVLAAGQGTRMKSDLPKVLHPIFGRPLITHLLDTLTSMDFERIIVVIGYKGEEVERALTDYDVQFVWQKPQHGTGHAVMVTESILGNFEGKTLVTLGDVPFLSAKTINGLYQQMSKFHSPAVCLSAIVEDPKGYGRIIRDDNSDRLKAITEEKDADAKTRQIKEINTGTFCFDNQHLFESLKNINRDNAQKEYYLTDCVKVLFEKGLTVNVVTCDSPEEGLGVNTPEDLAKLEQKFKNRD